MGATNLTKTKFAEFDLHPSLIQGLSAAGFEFCTPIQEKTLPHVLEGKDIAGQAQTGTGKTIAFLLAIMQKILIGKSEKEGVRKPQALILTPTRELALQVFEDAKLVGRHTGLRFGFLIGGSSYERQKKMLALGVDILIATPGRLIDFFKQRLVRFYDLKAVVLDEADRMFDMGFIKDIRYILRRTPEPAKRLGLLFSATLSYKVTELAYTYTNKPVKVEVEPEKILAGGLTEILYFPANNEKEALLVGMLGKVKSKKSIVFVNTKHVGERVWGTLKANGFRAFLLSGNVPQNQRVILLDKFKSEQGVVLVATDVAARGLHVDGVTHVFNYDLPQDREDYVHRIGRTARAGRSGEAISFACENYSFSIPDIEDYIGHKIPVGIISTDDLATNLKPAEKFKSRRIASHKKDKKSGSTYYKKQQPNHRPINNKNTQTQRSKTQKDRPKKRHTKTRQIVPVSWWRRLLGLH